MELSEEAALVSGAAKSDFGGGGNEGDRRIWRRLLNTKKDLINGDLKGAGQAFQSFDGGNGVAVFQARDVRAQHTSALLHFFLSEVPGFTQGAETLTDSHS